MVTPGPGKRHPAVESTLEPFLISTGIVALAEMGDKTQLLSFLLAARFRRALGCGTQVIATGGLSVLLPRDEGIVDHIDPYLTLDGLRLLWQEQRSSR